MKLSEWKKQHDIKNPLSTLRVISCEDLLNITEFDKDQNEHCKHTVPYYLYDRVSEQGESLSYFDLCSQDRNHVDESWKEHKGHDCLCSDTLN